MSEFNRYFVQFSRLCHQLPNPSSLVGLSVYILQETRPGDEPEHSVAVYGTIAEAKADGRWYGAPNPDYPFEKRWVPHARQLRSTGEVGRHEDSTCTLVHGNNA